MTKFESQIDEHVCVIEAMREHTTLLSGIAEGIISVFEGGGRLFILGNGGSAADAQHIAAELVGRLKVDRKALPAIALTTDTSVLTAVANDIGAENCFARQVDALVTKTDLVWALSVSGTSPNVTRALHRARAIGATTVGFTGQSGGEFIELCDLCFRAKHDGSDRVQEAHQLAYHLICERVEGYYLSRC